MVIRPELPNQKTETVDSFRPSMRVEVIAAAMDVNISTIYKLVRSGELEAMRVGKRGIRVFQDSLRDYQERNRIGKASKKVSQIKDKAAAQTIENKEAKAFLRSMGCL